MPKAIFENIYRQLKSRIEQQVYPYQSLLPSENHLVNEFDCSRNTVRRAIAGLISDGYVQAIHGKGVRVIYRPTDRASFLIGGIESFQETATRNHLRAVTKVACFEERIVDKDFAAVSGFEPGAGYYYIERVRYLNGKALILDINAFRKDCIRGLTPRIAEASIYDYIENHLHMQIVTSKRRITVERSTDLDTLRLDLDSYDFLAVITSQAFLADGTLFEYTSSRHHPNYFCFQDTATRKKL